MTRRARVIVGVVVAIVVIDLGLAGLDRLEGGPNEGPASSTFTSSAHGLAAYAELLRDAGHTVTQQRAPLARTTLDLRSTVVVLDTTISPDDALALQRFVQLGGHLIIGGVLTTGLRGIVPDPPSLAPIAIDDSTPLAPAPEVTVVSHVRSDEPASWTRTHSALPVLGQGALTLLAVQDVGLGRIGFLASASPLQDALLGTEDDAALGLALAGPSSRPVVFDESGHGFGDTGVDAIPAPAREAVIALIVAALLWIASRIRRLGPPTPSERPLPPPRRLFVSSLAQTLARTRGRRAAVLGLCSAARGRLARLASLPRDADDAAFIEAAHRFGLSDVEASAIVRGATNDEEVVAAGRAYAKLSGD